MNGHCILGGTEEMLRGIGGHAGFEGLYEAFYKHGI